MHAYAYVCMLLLAERANPLDRLRPTNGNRKPKQETGPAKRGSKQTTTERAAKTTTTKQQRRDSLGDMMMSRLPSS